MRATPLWLFTIACVLTGHARQAEQVPTIQTTTRAVILDVVVTGKNNRPVAGLTKEDFLIEEDKTPQKILSFESVSVNSPDPRPAPETILLVDEMNTRIPDFAYVRYCLKKLLARNNGKLDQLTMLMVLSDEGLKVLAEPTRDGALLESAMQHLPPEIPLRLSQHSFYATVERINLSLQAIQKIAVANAGSGTRKNIVWISPGFPALEPLPGDASDQAKYFETIRTLSDQFLKARIAIYTIDPRGVFAGGLHANYLNGQQFRDYLSSLRVENRLSFQDLALTRLAFQTGGRALWGRNDVDQEIADSIGDGGTYYTISYSPANKNFDGMFRNVKVTLPEHPELHARTRDGYYALPEPPPPTPKTVDEQISDALISTLKYKAIPILSTSTSLVSVPSRAWIGFTVKADSLSWSPLSNGKIQTKVQVAVTDLSKKDQVRHVVDRTYTAVLDQTSKPNVERRISFRIATPVTLPPNRLRLVIRDEVSGLIGTADITDFPPVQKQQPSDYLQRRTP
jgi:VWFA-related protein